MAGMTRAAIVAIVALGACKKAAPLTDQLEGLGGSDVQDIGSALQAVAISPGQVPIQTAMRAQIFGAGFEDGVAVEVGDISLTDVSRQDVNSLSVQLPGLDAGIYDVVVTNPDGRTSVLRSGLSVSAGVGTDCRNTLVYFALNQSGLTADAKALLTTQAPCFNTSAAPIDVEGHADERGTTDYNVALGQRRAKSVVSFLQIQGVSASRTKVVSFGEERPRDGGHTEASWAKNRRVEVHLH